MKVISLWQPWATAIALGSKRIETRHWPTRYRGPLLIHAAKRTREFKLCMTMLPFQGALFPVAGKNIPFGAIVALGELVDCLPTESFGAEIDEERRSPSEDAPDAYRWCERDMGDFYPGRYGWVLEDVKALANPITYRGAQGLFNVTDAEVLERVRMEVATL